jgi:transposase
MRKTNMKKGGHAPVDEGALERLIYQGASIREIADELGVHRQTVTFWADRLALGNKLREPKKAVKSEKPMKPPKPEPMPAAYHYKMPPDEFIACVNAGMLPKEIAARFGVTHQAVRDRALRAGLVAKLKANRPVPKCRKEQPPTETEMKYGMSKDEIRRHRASGATRAYITQRGNARRREVEWLFTFASWWKVWEESGKWDERGRNGLDYVMARCGDVGPYAAGNVYICTNAENASDAWKNSPGRLPVCREQDWRGKFLPPQNNPTKGIDSH